MEEKKKTFPMKRLAEIISIMKKHQLIKNMNPVSLREALEELGPTFIKIGQIMADREDLLDPAYCDELRKLRSQVRPMSEEVIIRILKNELQEKRFEFTDIEAIPVGSASIAQVHRAKLNGKDVALKIERENIEYQMETDISLLKKIVHLVPIERIFHISVDFDLVLDEMLESAKKEMDFEEEAKFMEEFREKNKDVSYIGVPLVYHDYTTKHLLVMEYIDAPKINEVALLEMQGYQMDQVALLLAKNYLKQTLDDGFYHADPHPDNIKLKDGKIVYLDFGMMGRLTEENKALLKKCVEAILWQDHEKLAQNVILLGHAEHINQSALAEDLAILLDQNQNTEIGSIDLKTFAPQLMSIFQKYQISVPRDIILLLRGIVVIEGVLEDIDPNISLMEALKTQFEPSSLLTPDNMKKQLMELAQNISAFSKLPKEILSFHNAIQNGNVTFQVETSPSKEALKTKKDQTICLVLALLDCCFLIGICFTLLSTKEIALFFTILFTNCFLVTSFLLLLKILFSFQKKG